MQVLNKTSPAARGTEVGNPARRRPRPSFGPVAAVLVVGAAYYLTAVVSLRVALVQGIVTSLWPPTGIAVAALLIFGYPPGRGSRSRRSW
jgi:hypothetical protein